MIGDRQHFTVNERAVVDDMNNISKTISKAVMDGLGWLYSDLLGFAAANWFYNQPSNSFRGAVHAGFNASASGADKVVHISPGVAFAYDPAVTEAYDTPIQIVRVDSEYTNTIADEAGGQEKWYVYSVPATKALAETDADTSARDFKAPNSSTITPTNTAKRRTLEVAITQTAGVAAAIGAATEPAVPAGHVKLWAVRKEAATNIVQWPLATYTLPGAAAYIANFRDHRAIAGPRWPLKAYEQDGTTLIAKPGNVLQSLGVARAGGRFTSNGSADPTPEESFGIKSLVYGGSAGTFTLTLTKAMVGTTKWWGHVGLSAPNAGPIGMIGYLDPTSTTVATVLFVRTDTGVATSPTATNKISITIYGEQVA